MTIDEAELRRRGERLHAATLALHEAHSRYARAFQKTDPAIERTDEERRVIIEEVTDAVRALHRCADDWLFYNAAIDGGPLGFPAGTMVVVNSPNEHGDRNVLTRSSGAVFVDGDGEHVVAVEGCEGLYPVEAVFVIDDVRAFFGQYSSGEPVSPGELGETGCEGCTRLGAALCVLQEAHRRFVNENWIARFPPPARPPGPPLYGPGSPDDRPEEPEDPDAN